MSWSGEQLRILRALGHEPFMPVGAAPVAAAFGREQSRPEAEPGPSVAAGSAVADTATLLAALARAAGGSDLSPLALDVARLRREPALKRALWPRLRALRREH